MSVPAGTRVAPSNDNNPEPPPEPVKDRAALGRSRSGLTTKIHLAGDQDCRPMARVVIYKTRDTVERTINRLRGYRAVATRYDKREFVYRETIDVATIGIWLR